MGLGGSRSIISHIKGDLLIHYVKEFVTGNAIFQ